MKDKRPQTSPCQPDQRWSELVIANLRATEWSKSYPPRQHDALRGQTKCLERLDLMP